MTDAPAGYPFPGDEVVYCSAYDGFDPDAGSYVAVARLPEAHAVEINGKRHDNTHRLVIHSPVRGPESFLVNPSADWLALLSAVLVLMAEDPDKHGGPGSATFSRSFLERKTGVDLSGGASLSPDEAEDIANLLRSNEEALIAEFATDPVVVSETDSGRWADELERRAGGSP